MIEFKIDVKKRELHFECKGGTADIAADSMVFLRQMYDTIEKVSGEDMAGGYIRYVIDMLKNPQSGFYDPVDWDAEEKEDPKC